MRRFVFLACFLLACQFAWASKTYEHDYSVGFNSNVCLVGVCGTIANTDYGADIGALVDISYLVPKVGGSHFISYSRNGVLRIGNYVICGNENFLGGAGIQFAVDPYGYMYLGFSTKASINFSVFTIGARYTYFLDGISSFEGVLGFAFNLTKFGGC